MSARAGRLATICGLVTAVSSLAQAESGGDTATPRPSPRVFVVLIGGMGSDPTPGQIAGTAARREGNSGLYRLRGDLQGDSVLPRYFNWNGSVAGKLQSRMAPGPRGIAQDVRTHLQAHPGDRLVLVGNSWGGHTALDVARQLDDNERPLAVHLLVLLDASSAGRGGNPSGELPRNINSAVHYFTRNAFTWGTWQAGPRLRNIDLGNLQNGFLRDGGPQYDAAFNFAAHVAAEWDEEIHKDIIAAVHRQMQNIEATATPRGD